MFLRCYLIIIDFCVERKNFWFKYFNLDYIWFIKYVDVNIVLKVEKNLLLMSIFISSIYFFNKWKLVKVVCYIFG